MRQSARRRKGIQIQARGSKRNMHLAASARGQDTGRQGNSFILTLCLPLLNWFLGGTRGGDGQPDSLAHKALICYTGWACTLQALLLHFTCIRQVPCDRPRALKYSTQVLSLLSLWCRSAWNTRPPDIMSFLVYSTLLSLILAVVFEPQGSEQDPEPKCEFQARTTTTQHEDCGPSKGVVVLASQRWTCFVVG